MKFSSTYTKLLDARGIEALGAYGGKTRKKIKWAEGLRKNCGTSGVLFTNFVCGLLRYRV